MADVELVIKIPEDEYRWIIKSDETVFANVASKECMLNAIKSGIPLPNNFDLEGLKQDMKALNCGFPYGLDYLLDCIKNRLGITIN